MHTLLHVDCVLFLESRKTVRKRCFVRGKASDQVVGIQVPFEVGGKQEESDEWKEAEEEAD